MGEKRKVFQVHRVLKCLKQNPRTITQKTELPYKMCYHLFLAESIAILEVMLLKERSNVLKLNIYKQIHTKEAVFFLIP